MFRSTMGAFDEEELCWPPNDNPMDIDKEWRHRAETELNEDTEKVKENMKLLAKKLAGMSSTSRPNVAQN